MSYDDERSKPKLELDIYYLSTEDEYGIEIDEKEKKLAEMVLSIVNETELPKFPVPSVTSVKNSTVEEKGEFLLQIEELAGSVIPESLLSEPWSEIAYGSDVIEKAPWVNIIHAWMKVLNEMNTVAAIQMEEATISPDLIASIAQTLFLFTTDYDKDYHNRTNKQFINRSKYPETTRRDSGTKGVNARRHVCFEEMKWILNSLKQAFKHRRTRR